MSLDMESSKVNGELEVQQEGSLPKNSGLTNDSNEDTSGTTDSNKDSTPSICRLGSEEKAFSEKQLPVNNLIVCNGFGGQCSSPESSQQSEGEKIMLSNGMRAEDGEETGDVLNTDSRLTREESEEIGDTPLPNPVTMTDTAVMAQSQLLEMQGVEENSSQQGDSGFLPSSSSTPGLVSMASQDEHHDFSPPNGECVCFTPLLAVRCATSFISTVVGEGEIVLEVMYHVYQKRVLANRFVVNGILFCENVWLICSVCVYLNVGECVYFTVLCGEKSRMNMCICVLFLESLRKKISAGEEQKEISAGQSVFVFKCNIITCLLLPEGKPCKRNYSRSKCVCFQV